MGTLLPDLAASGPLLAGIAVAALAGLVSFFAPCMLPLVPGYLSYVPDYPAPSSPPARRSAKACPGQIGI